jgi:hypothetical protein
MSRSSARLLGAIARASAPAISSVLKVVVPVLTPLVDEADHDAQLTGLGVRKAPCASHGWPLNAIYTTKTASSFPLIALYTRSDLSFSGKGELGLLGGV